MSHMSISSNVKPPHTDALKPFDSSVLEKPVGEIWNDFDIIGCYDTEYCPHDGFEKHIDPTRVNFLLSMQLSIFYKHGDGWEYAEGLRKPDGYRPELADVAGWALDLAHIPRRTEEPVKVLLVAHFSVAEWSMLSDRQDLKPLLTPIGKTVVTLAPIKLAAKRPGRHTTPAAVTIRDTMLLTPGRGSLDKASQVTPVKKLKLGDYGHSAADMLKLLYEAPGVFDEYAITDTRAGLAYMVILGNKVEDIIGVPNLPVTLGGMSALGFIVWQRDFGYGQDHYHGREKKIIFEDGKQKEISVRSVNRSVTDKIATPCFHGGRNYAATHRREKLPRHQLVVDFDLAGAYPVAMATLPLVDLTLPPILIHDVSQLLEKFSACQHDFMPIGLGEVEYEFPPGVEPCLPVPTDIGLQYPRCGTSPCGLPEVLLALHRGAKIQLKSFYLWRELSFDGAPRLAFADYLNGLVLERAKHPAGSLENLLFKEASNSLYGKLAQGSKIRRVRDLEGEYNDLPESSVTNVLYAAMTTSLVRAALCSIEAAMSAGGAEVLAATTDGAMAIFDVGENTHYDMQHKPSFADLLPDFDLAAPGNFSIRAMQLGRRHLTLDPAGWIEAKHLGDAFEVFKTRGYYLTLRDEVTFLARGGHKIDGTPVQIREKLDALFDEQTPSVLPLDRLSSCFDIADYKSSDLVKVSLTRTANFDWDWKRKLLDDGTTVPFENVEEIFKYREASAIVRKRGKRATREATELNLNGLKIHGGTEATINRHLLRAIVRNVGGWSSGNLTTDELAERLGVTTQTIKNARQRKFKAHSLPRGESFERVAADLCNRLGLVLTDEMRDAVCAT